MGEALYFDRFWAEKDQLTTHLVGDPTASLPLTLNSTDRFAVTLDARVLWRDLFFVSWKTFNPTVPHCRFFNTASQRSALV